MRPVTSPERDAIKGMLQALEHTVDAKAAVSVAAGQLLAAQQSGKPLSPPTLAHYKDQFRVFADQREQMRQMIARWWTLLEETPQ